MTNSKLDIQGFNVAINESSLLDVKLDTYRSAIIITLRILTLPENKFPPENPVVEITLEPVSRFVAILKNGKWDDSKAEIVQLKKEDLSEVVESFKGAPMYGWEFLEHAKDLRFDKVSFEYESQNASLYKIRLFQATSEHYLEFHIWFSQITIKDYDSNDISIEQFIADGKRWWDGLNNGDPRTTGGGIYPLKGEREEDR